MGDHPKIFVFCNNAGYRNRGSWHYMVGIAEDGTCLAGHICSQHGYATHDMGIAENGLKRDLYAKHYPGGFEVVWVGDPDTHEGLKLALERNAAAAPADRQPEEPSK